jgi:hypothetical protein
VDCPEQRNSPLPDPDGQLSSKVPSSSIISANNEVKMALSTSAKHKRGTYDRFTPEEKAIIARRGIENGVTKTVRQYNKSLQDRKLKESTVRPWITHYKRQLDAQRCIAMDGVSAAAPIEKLQQKRRGRPLLLGEELDGHVREYIAELRRNGGIINAEIVSSAATGIVKNVDANLLESNGGHISCTHEWAKGLLKRMGYVKRRANTKSKISVEKFEALKAQFNFDIQVIAEMEDVPNELVINWDHTGINYVPTSSWTMAEQGSSRVEIVGLGDKRQITAVLACSLSGDFLPPQIIYSGKTPKCLPSVSYPSNWHITYTNNHWANEKTTIDHINNVLLPYINEVRRKLSLSSNHTALVIFDRFKGQCTSTVLQLLSDNHIQIAIVPANLTDRLQPLDISVNKAVKEHLRKEFSRWYSEQLCTKIKSNPSATVDLSMSTLKPLGVKWLVSMYDYIKVNKEIIVNGFTKAGINSRK